MLAFEFDVFRYMFDVIVDEVKKYSPNARKLKAKAGKQFEKLDVITIVHVKIERKPVKHAASINLQRYIHVKSAPKHRTSKPKHVKLGRDLLSRSQKLPCFAEKLPCFAENMLRLHLDIAAAVRDVHERISREIKALATDDLALIGRNACIIRPLEVSCKP